MEFNSGVNDGKIVINTSDGLCFYAHKSILKRASNYFRSAVHFNKCQGKKLRQFTLDYDLPTLIIVIEYFYDPKMYSKTSKYTVDLDCETIKQVLGCLALIHFLDLADGINKNAYQKYLVETFRKLLNNNNFEETFFIVICNPIYACMRECLFDHYKKMLNDDFIINFDITSFMQKILKHDLSVYETILDINNRQIVDSQQKQKQLKTKQLEKKVRLSQYKALKAYISGTGEIKITFDHTGISYKGTHELTETLLTHLQELLT